MVSGTSCSSVVASTKTAWAGGSSSTFNRASKAWRAEHVHFVNDVDPVAAEGGPGLHLLPQGPGVLHRGPAGGVDFHDVQVSIRMLRGLAGIAHAAGSGRRALTQFRARARMRAVLVLPVPRTPANRKA